MKELGITKGELMKKIEGEGIEIGFCPSCGHGARRLPKKGVDFCENPECNWQKKYIGNTLSYVPKNENFRDKSEARKHADRIWNTQDLSDISDFNIPLSTAVGMMENFSKEQNSELLERYNEAIEACEKMINAFNEAPKDWLMTQEVINASKEIEQTISKAKP